MNFHEQLYLDHLNHLKEEISLYKDEDKIWKVTGEIKNPPGNLCLHMCGNLNHYFGSTLGKTGYIRQRDLEFSKKNVSREELVNGIEETKKMISNLFQKLNENDLKSNYPDNSFGENATIDYVISRLVSHLAYHLGQINYHRRILDV